MPGRGTYQEQKLVGWIKAQSSRLNNNSLHKEQIAAITALLGEDWWVGIDPIEVKRGDYKTWDCAVESLKNLINSQRRADEPQKNTQKQFTAGLGEDWWVGIDPIEVKRGDYKTWKKSLKKLENFCEINNRRPTYGRENSKEYFIAQWVGREALKKRNNELSSEREKAITALLGEDWWVEPKDIWEEHFNALVDFLKIKGRRPIYGTDEQEKVLREFLQNQRKYCRDGALSDEKTKRLELVLGEDWMKILPPAKNSNPNLSIEFWEKLEAIVKFIDNYGRRPAVGKNDEEGLLGKWILDNATNYHRGILSKQKIKIFNSALGENWAEILVKKLPKKITNTWRETFERLEYFVNTNKRRPNSGNGQDEESFLGNWLVNEAIKYRRGKEINQNKIDTITALLGEDWWESKGLGGNRQPPITKAWEESFKKLKQFLEENGRRPVNKRKGSEEDKLGQWLMIQAGKCRDVSYRSTRLKDEQKKSLTALLGEDWWVKK